MMFWDTRRWFHDPDEPKSSDAGDLAKDPEILTSAFTTIEVASAVWRRRHANQLSLSAHQETDELFAELSMTWTEIAVLQDAIDNAIGAMSRYPLRAGDALQLGTAFLTAPSPHQLRFVTLDEDLAAAARAEGFPVLP
jgi:predicted nucleic acid-binding protein